MFMIRWLAPVAFLFFTACDSPSPAFMGADATIIVVQGSQFSVHRRDDWVEVYRTSFEYLPRREVVLARAQVAIEQATGCTVKPRSLTGDQALIRAQLKCANKAPPPLSG